MTPPNTDGCECRLAGATTGPCCAGETCPIRHSDGLGEASSVFYDCVPTGMIDSQLAQDACVAYVGAGNASACQLYDNPGDGGVMNAWCSGPLTGDCICWTFSGLFQDRCWIHKPWGLQIRRTATVDRVVPHSTERHRPRLGRSADSPLRRATSPRGCPRRGRPRGERPAAPSPPPACPCAASSTEARGTSPVGRRELALSPQARHQHAQGCLHMTLLLQRQLGGPGRGVRGAVPPPRLRSA